MSFHRFITVLLIGVVLINVIGPILDHHFVERGHNHDHLYLSVTAADHSHVYDSKHSHKSHVSNVFRTLSDSDDNIVIKKAKMVNNVSKYIENKKIIKNIYLKNKLINFIIEK